MIKTSKVKADPGSITTIIRNRQTDFNPQCARNKSYNVSPAADSTFGLNSSNLPIPKSQTELFLLLIMIVLDTCSPHSHIHI